MHANITKLTALETSDYMINFNNLDDLNLNKINFLRFYVVPLKL